MKPVQFKIAKIGAVQDELDNPVASVKNGKFMFEETQTDSTNYTTTVATK